MTVIFKYASFRQGRTWKRNGHASSKKTSNSWCYSIRYGQRESASETNMHAAHLIFLCWLPAIFRRNGLSVCLIAVSICLSVRLSLCTCCTNSKVLGNQSTMSINLSACVSVRQSRLSIAKGLSSYNIPTYHNGCTNNWPTPHESASSLSYGISPVPPYPCSQRATQQFTRGRDHRSFTTQNRPQLQHDTQTVNFDNLRFKIDTWKNRVLHTLYTFLCYSNGLTNCRSCRQGERVVCESADDGCLPGLVFADNDDFVPPRDDLILIHPRVLYSFEWLPSWSSVRYV